MSTSATYKADSEKITAWGSEHYLRDEWFVARFNIPLIFSLCGEWGRAIVAEGFTALETMPDWSQYALGVIVATSVGMRSATNFFGNKKS